jgi:Beta-carotene isomerase D27-like, C-terminal
MLPRPTSHHHVTRRCERPCLKAIVILVLCMHQWQVHGWATTNNPRLPIHQPRSSGTTRVLVSQHARATTLLTSSSSSDVSVNIASDILSDLGSVIQTFTLADRDVTPNQVLEICDEINRIKAESTSDTMTWDWLRDQIRTWSLQQRRYELLVKMMRANYTTYVTTAAFLGDGVYGLERWQLPNVQDVPYPAAPERRQLGTTADESGLLQDCQLPAVTFQDNLLDIILLKVFRQLVTQNTGGITSELPGITGLLDQGRTFLLQPNQTAEAQHEMVKATLGQLMTPVLPPFYRIFMSGIVPSKKDGQQFGPWFYAPFLTALVTPIFFQFLVGPSIPNRRTDGQVGGLLVTKCKFLQESNCKGLCLHQCKIPAQEFFADTLGLPLTVVPNFESQECQWSFGQVPVRVDQDPSFPTGCLNGCPSREILRNRDGKIARKTDLCNA